MRGPSPSRTALAVLASLILLCAVAAVSLAAGPVRPFEAPLNPAGEAYEVNTDSGGNAWISDFGAGEVWQVKPDGSYTVYGGLGLVMGAHPGAPGEVWYGGSGDCTLGRLSTAAPGATTWSLGTGCNAQTVLYDSGRVWVADFATPRLYSFDATSRNLCTYTLPDGGVPRYLAVQAGQIWYGDQTNGHIVRLDPAPATPQATSWQLPADATAYGLAANPDNTVWWTDPVRGTVDHFAPATNQLTAYALAEDSRPELLAAAAGSMWYTDDQTGAIGQVDPAVAGGTVSTLTASTPAVTRSCQTLPAGTAQAVTTRQGTLAFTDSVYTATTTSGITTYQLAAGALPWGIAANGNTLLASDRGRHMLVKLAPVNLNNKLYLPSTSR